MTHSWHQSAPHAALLSKFRSARPLTSFDEAHHLQAALQEPPADAVRRFVDEGFLGRASLEERVAASGSVADLKKHLKERGLKVSGRKDELVARLIEADSAAAEHLGQRGGDLYQCTEQGLQLTDRFIEWDRQRTEDAHRAILHALQRTDIASAISSAHELLRSEPLPNPLQLLDSEHHARILGHIARAWPQLLNGIDPNSAPLLRLHAAFTFLVGRSKYVQLPSGFAESSHLDDETAARMLLFHAQYLERVADLRSADATGVELSCVHDKETCEGCRRASQNRYTLVECPELPLPTCTSSMGCRCTVVMSE